MKALLRATGSMLMLAAGLALFFVHTDQKVISVSPLEGQLNAIVLESNQIYQQTFSAPNDGQLSRFGLFLRPNTQPLIKGEVTVKVQSEGLTATQTVSTDFIDSAGATQVRFSPGIPARSGANVMVTMQVPKNLSGQIRAQARPPDESFAYQVYYRQRPPLALHLASVFILAALLMLFPLPPPILLGLVALFLAPWQLKILAIPAALALHLLHQFLGHDRLVNGLMYTIVILAYLELLHVRT